MTIYKTEGDVYRAIVKRFDPPAYAVLPGVANATGSNRARVVDAIIASLWPSRGITIEGVEIKVSRGDWLRELRDPAKQEPVMKYCDRFWLAVGDSDIVKDGELPRTWGLLVPGRGGKMKIATKAPDLEPEPLSRGFVASILRRTNEAVAGDEIRRSIRAEVEAEVEAKMEKLRAASMPLNMQSELNRLREVEAMVVDFERAAGVRFTKWQSSQLERAAAIVKHSLAAERSLSAAGRDVDLAAERLREVKAAVEGMKSRISDLEAGEQLGLALPEGK